MWTGWTPAISLPWWQHRKECPWYYCYLCRKRLFLVRSFCLSVRRITDKFSWRGRAWPRNQWIRRSGSPSRSSSPKSEIHGIIEKVTNRVWWNFMQSWGCGLETNWLHFGDDPRHSPNPGRTATSTHTEQTPCKNRSAILLCWRSAEVCALWVLLVIIIITVIIINSIDLEL